jgi:hypothetical protein
MSNKPMDHTIPKACKVCGIVKNPIEFYPINRSKDRKHLPQGRAALCKICHNKGRSDYKKSMGEEWHKIENKRKRDWADKNPERSRYNLKNARLKRQFGITSEDYDSMFQAQNGLCDICKKPEPGRGKLGRVKDLAVDHCHTTGKIRGLLCFHCNSSIGKMQDSVEILQSAIDYLIKHKK